MATRTRPPRSVRDPDPDRAIEDWLYFGREIGAVRPADSAELVDMRGRVVREAGGVDGVHIYSNVVTVDLAVGATADGMEQIIRDLFTYYRPGVEVVEPTA